jgi:predicted DNA binding CopG/RHH family protein
MPPYGPYGPNLNNQGQQPPQYPYGPQPPAQGYSGYQGYPAPGQGYPPQLPQMQQPPPMNPYGQSGPYMDPYAYQQMPATARGRGRKLLFVAAMVVLMLGLGAVGFAMLGGNKAMTNDELWQTALGNALSTKNLTIDYEKEDVKQTYKADFGDPKVPKISSRISDNTDDAKLEIEGYGTLRDSFIKITESDEPSQGLEVGKWLELRKDGALPTGLASALFYELQLSPSSVMYDMVFLGNYQQVDQLNLLALINSKKLYSYDAASTTPASIDGQAVRQYKVTLNGEAYKEVLKQAAALVALDEARIQEWQDLFDLSASTESSLVISIAEKDQRIIQVDETSPVYGQIKIKYSAFGTTQVGEAPKAEAKWGDTDESGQASNDSIRKAHIGNLRLYLKAYYDQRGTYPTFAQLNDPAWRQVNFSGLSDAYFKDPEGSTGLLAGTPSVGRYAYQVSANATGGSCDGKATICGYFALTAVLDNDFNYTRTSVQ